MIYQEILASQSFQVLILTGPQEIWVNIIWTSFGIDLDNAGVEPYSAHDIRRGLTSCGASEDMNDDDDSSKFLRISALVRRSAFILCSLPNWPRLSGFSDLSSEPSISNAISDRIIDVFLRHELSVLTLGGYMQCLGWYQNYPTCSPSPHCTVC